MNMLEKYTAVAKKWEAELMKRPDVLGVMHLGGIARQRADEDSDIDIAFFSREPVSDIVLGERITEEGCDVELFNIAMNEGFDNWSPIMREAYAEGFVSSDKTGEVADFIARALEYRDEYRNKYMAELIFEIAWHGWIYTPFRNRTIHGYAWILPKDLWFKRGVENNAYYLARFCVERFVELLFALNRKWTPDYKWRIIKSRKLPVLPGDYDAKIDYLLFAEWNRDTWEKKSECLQSMIDEIVPLAAADLPDDWYALIDK